MRRTIDLDTALQQHLGIAVAAQARRGRERNLQCADGICCVGH
jgi:hypothetical protein